MVVNDHGMVFGPVETQHCMLMGERTRYSPEGRYDGMACMVYNDKFEIRLHQKWRQESVRVLFDNLSTAVFAALAQMKELPPEVPSKLGRYCVVYGSTDLGAFKRSSNCSPSRL
jgi:hypothetical protein